MVADMMPEHIAWQLKQRLFTQVRPLIAWGLTRLRQNTFSIRACQGTSTREFMVEHSEHVAVLFSEICDFGEFCNEAGGPLEVVRVLNTMFAAFDALLPQHSVYKVETVGSVYMAATGLPFLQANSYAVPCIATRARARFPCLQCAALHRALLRGWQFSRSRFASDGKRHDICLRFIVHHAGQRRGAQI